MSDQSGKRADLLVLLKSESILVDVTVGSTPQSERRAITSKTKLYSQDAQDQYEATLVVASIEATGGFSPSFVKLIGKICQDVDEESEDLLVAVSKILHHFNGLMVNSARQAKRLKATSPDTLSSLSMVNGEALPQAANHLPESATDLLQSSESPK